MPTRMYQWHECIRDARKDDTWDKVWAKIEQIASAVGVTVCKPRTASLQCHRANSGATGCQTPSDYYRINVYYPFIDHVVEELDTRFANEHKGLVAVQHLVPANLKT